MVRNFSIFPTSRSFNSAFGINSSLRCLNLPATVDGFITLRKEPADCARRYPGDILANGNSHYDWNSGPGLINALLPALYFGHSIVGCPSGRTIPRLFTLLEHYQVTNILTTAEELERIRDYDETLPAFDLAIRCIAIPDHEKTTSLNAWVKQRFNATLNGIYSDVAFVYLAGDSAEKWPDRENSMGHIYPGRRFSIIDDEGMPVAVGTKGVLAVAAIDYHGHDDPGLATHYWQQAQIHEIETVDGWYSTGIAAYQDKDGYIFRV